MFVEGSSIHIKPGPGASALENLGKLKLRAGILRTQEAALRNDGRFTDDEKERIAALQRDVAASGGTIPSLVRMKGASGHPARGARVNRY